MLTVNASAKPSEVNGIGLFANEKILKGTVTWKFDPRFDVTFDPKDVAAMEPRQKALVERYSYLSTTSGKYVYSIDDSRFTNHSAKNSNIGSVPLAGSPEKCGVATRDIEAGEEMLVNYRAFDAADEASTDAYLDF
jgi:SET domain-containing protein